MNKRNYQKELEKVMMQLENEKKVPTLLLHSCCAPCSTYVIDYLSKYFKITVFYYNPNIDKEIEYRKRVEEQKKLITQMPTKYKVDFIEGEYEVEKYIESTKHLKEEKEGGTRCSICYALRLEKTAKLAKEKGYEYFTTTLTISPLKNAQKLNDIGEQLGKKYNMHYLVSDFKKKEGYKKSVEMSKEYDLYRQNYCGCSYSEYENKKHSNPLQ